MKRMNQEEIVYETFYFMCRLLKEKSGVYNKSIAIDLNIDFSIFSKLLGGKRLINDGYKDKIYSYLIQDDFSVYSQPLKNHIYRLLKIDKKSDIYRRIDSMSYKTLLYQLFYDAESLYVVEDDGLTKIFIHYLRKYFAACLDNRSLNPRAYRQVKDDHLREMEHLLKLPERSIIEIGLMEDHAWKSRTYILLCPEKWEIGAILSKNPDLVEQAKYFLIIHLKPVQRQRFYNSRASRYHSDSVIEVSKVETIEWSKMREEARRLARHIMKKLTSGEIYT